MGKKPKLVSTEMIHKFANEHGIELSTAESVLWLSLVLREISASSIGKDFALIGGSAIVFLYQDMYRFSTDLDLDFIGDKNLGKKSSKEVDKRIVKDEEVFREIALTLGLKFKKKNKRDRFVQYELHFSTRLTGMIELDVSYLYCHSILGTVMKDWRMEAGGLVKPFKVKTQKLEELYAGKITAVVATVEPKEHLDFKKGIGLLFKKKARHLFDIYQLMTDIAEKKTEIKFELLHELVVLFGMTRIKNFEYRRGDALGEYTEEQFVVELYPVLSGDAIPDPEVIKWEVRKFFDARIFNWSEKEHRFIEDFKHKLFRPEDLFGKGDVANQIKNMHYYKEIMEKIIPFRKP